MPRSILLNVIVLATGTLYPGQPIDADQVAAVQSAGGTVASDADPNIASASAVCEGLRLDGRATADVLASIMQNAVNKTQTAGIDAGVTGPTGDTGSPGATGSPGSATAFSAGATTDWATAPPVTIKAAIDRIAAAVAAGVTGPIG